MAAAALTFRETLEVWLVVTVAVSFAGGGVRQHIRPLLVALGAALLLGFAIGAGGGAFGATLADALPRAGLIPSPHVGPDRGMSPIATVLGITSIVLIARFAIRGCQFQPRPSRVIPAATVAWWSR